MEHKALWALRFLNFDPSLAGDKRKVQLVQLDEMRDGAYHSNRKYKAKVKVSHDKKIKHKEFRPGQSVLLFNSRMRLFPGKQDKVVRSFSNQGSERLWCRRLARSRRKE